MNYRRKRDQVHPSPPRARAALVGDSGTDEVMLLTDLTDEQLLEQSLAGNEDAFAALYRKRQGPIFRFAMHMSGSAHVAEEVTQEVFLFLVQRGRDFDPARGSLAAYLFGVARNYVRRALERGYPEQVLGSPVEDEAAALMVECDPTEGIARRQTSNAVWKAVLSLPEHYREVVVLCDLHELSYADAAQAAGCAIGTIRSRLHRAHEMLSRKLQHSAAVAPRISKVAARCVS
jgi:RNA polymerase sigma-70 factor (ECF subfamily)